MDFFWAQHKLSGSPLRHWQGAVETPNCLWLHPVCPLGPAPLVPALSSTPHATQVVWLLTAASPARCHRSRYQTHPVTAPVASITASVISYLGRRPYLLACDFCLANWSESIYIILIFLTLFFLLIVAMLWRYSFGIHSSLTTCSGVHLFGVNGAFPLTQIHCLNFLC